MLAMRNLYRVAEAGTCTFGQVGAASLNIRRDGYGFASTVKAQEKSPGPRDFFCCGVRLRDGRGGPGLQRQIARRLHTWRHAGEVP